MTTPNLPRAQDDVNLDEALQFIDHLAAPSRDDGVCLGLMVGTRAIPGTKEAFIPGSVRRTNHDYPRCRDELARCLRLAVEADNDVYISAHPFASVADGPRKENAAARVYFAWADIDDGDWERLRPTILLETSPDRFQGLWRLTEPVDSATAEALSRRIAAHIGADPSGGDLTQLLRLPGTRNFSRPGCPLVRLVHDDGPEYDVGPLRSRLPPLPERPTSRPTMARPVIGSGLADDEPPFSLTDGALARWRGEMVVRTSDGRIDRSKSLCALCRALYDAGLAARLLEPELRASDVRLGWHKYADRPDAEAYYADIVARIVGSGRARDALLPASPSDQLGASAAIASLTEDASVCSKCRAKDAENAALRERVRRLDAREAVRRNRRLGAAREGAAELGQAVADLAAQGPPSDPRGYDIRAFDIARVSGIPVKTVRKHAAVIGDHPMTDTDCARFDVPVGTPLWTVTEVQRPRQNPDASGRLNGTVTQLFIRPNVPADQVLAALGTMDLPSAPKQGGVRCPHHPNAPVLPVRTTELAERTHWVCSECHKPLRTERRVLRTFSGPSDHVVRSADDDARLASQDALVPLDRAADRNEAQPSDHVVHTTRTPHHVVRPVQSQESKAAARRDFERRHRPEEARNLLRKLQSRGIGVRRVDGGLLIDGEERLSDRDQGLVAELELEICDWLALEASQALSVDMVTSILAGLDGNAAPIESEPNARLLALSRPLAWCVEPR